MGVGSGSGSLHLTYISGHIFSKIKRKAEVYCCVSVCIYIYIYIITTCIDKYTMFKYTCECMSNMH